MTYTLDGWEIGPNQPPFVVAEIGMNHNGDVELGKKTIRAAAKAGADAIKLQSFRTDQFLSDEVDAKEEYHQYELSQEDHERLQSVAAACDVTFLSTPLDRESVDMLENLGVPCYKIASSDLTNYPFLEYVAEKGKPMILSTGYAKLSEVARAIETVRAVGNSDILLLHCISNYPTPPEEMNLRAMETLREAFDVPVGLSDHTQKSPVAPVTATALGARLVEKHFTLDNDIPGFDHGMSENPDSFATMVDQIQATFQALGSGEKRPRESELENREGARRSLYWDGDYGAGTTVQPEMVRAMRPGDGIPPERVELLQGTELTTDTEAGEQVQYSHVEWDGE